jgi:CheY-like chemotaxis protein
MPRILIVDDEPDVRELVETLLAAPGRQIEGADGGRAALERLAAATSPSCDRLLGET